MVSRLVEIGRSDNVSSVRRVANEEEETRSGKKILSPSYK